MTRKQWQWLSAMSVLSMGLIVMAHYLFDLRVTEYIHNTVAAHSVWLSVAQKWSNTGLGWPYLTGLGLLFLWARFVSKQQQIAWNSAYLWLSVATSGVVCDLLKEIFGRPRPVLFFEHHLTDFVFFAHRQFSMSNYNSFPSGHTTTAAAFAVGVMLLYPRLRLPSLLFILSIAVVRVLLLRHYVSDVMAGALLGALTSVILYALMKKRVSKAQQVCIE